MLSYIACLAEGGAWDKEGLEQQLEIHGREPILIHFDYYDNFFNMLVNQPPDLHCPLYPNSRPFQFAGVKMRRDNSTSRRFM